MKSRIPLAWLQLTREKFRLVVAIAGVSFAVILVFMQLGFKTSVFESATRYHRALDYDLVMMSLETAYIGWPMEFSRRRLYQALAAEEVESISGLYMRQTTWKNPWEHNTRAILVVGIDPSRKVFLKPDIVRHLGRIRRQDVVVFDAHSRPEFGPVGTWFIERGPLKSELNDRRITVEGIFQLGSSFGIDGNIVTSDVNFRRIFPDQPAGHINLGLIQLRSGADPEVARRRLEAELENDVVILSKEMFTAHEVHYWRTTTPVGYVFGFGAIMGLIVGGVIVYQILFADVAQHLAEYATLKAIGYSNADLSSVVLQEAALLSILGYIPGLLATLGLYRFMAEATRLPIAMTLERSVIVMLLTFAMCGVAALVALRKVRSADPAEVFG
jgi:putative ABC transport system permease protein